MQTFSSFFPLSFIRLNLLPQNERAYKIDEACYILTTLNIKQVDHILLICTLDTTHLQIIT